MAANLCRRCGGPFTSEASAQLKDACRFHRGDYVCRPHTEGKQYYGVDVTGWDFRVSRLNLCCIH